jgi:nitrite reductase/ring-hydroxylating ferredoxin subunit
MKGYHYVCKLSELPNRRGRKFSLEEEDIAIFRIGNDVYAVSNICPHNKSQYMYDGYVDEEMYLACPIHGWKYNLLTGEPPFDCGNTTGKLPVYETRIINGEVWVKINTPNRKWSLF